MKMKVNNLPANYTNYAWIVCIECEGELWFYDAWNKSEEHDARAQAWEIERGHCYSVEAVTHGYC